MNKEDNNSSEMVILINQAKCLKCNEVVQSRHRHECKFCTCKNVMVDGGKDYIRRGFKDEKLAQECSVYLFQNSETPAPMGRFDVCYSW